MKASRAHTWQPCLTYILREEAQIRRQHHDIRRNGQRQLVHLLVHKVESRCWRAHGVIAALLQNVVGQSAHAVSTLPTGRLLLAEVHEDVSRVDPDDHLLDEKRRRIGEAVQTLVLHRVGKLIARMEMESIKTIACERSCSSSEDEYNRRGVVGPTPWFETTEA